MAGQTGLTWALSVRTTASPAAYTALAGLRTRSFKINNNPVDVTTTESTSRMRELLGDTGIVELEIDASGLYQKDAPNNMLPQLVWNGASSVFKMVSAGTSAGMTIEGPFVVAEYNLTAPFDGAVSFTVKLMSAGAFSITYTPTPTTPA